MRELQAIFETPPRVRVFFFMPRPPSPHTAGGVVRQVTRLENGELHDT
jgi:hypothetical protein